MPNLILFVNIQVTSQTKPARKSAAKTSYLVTLCHEIYIAMSKKSITSQKSKAKAVNALHRWIKIHYIYIKLYFMHSINVSLHSTKTGNSRFCF